MSFDRKLTSAVIVSVLILIGVGTVLVLNEPPAPEERRTIAPTDVAPSNGDADESHVVSNGRQTAAKEVGETSRNSASPDEPATLSGTVLGPDGESISGARVVIFRESPRISILDRIREGDRQSLRALILEHERGATKSGAVEQETAGNQVDNSTETSRDGRFSFAIESLPRGRLHVLASHEGLAADTDTWTWSSVSRVMDFRLARARTIQGVVVDREGNGLQGVTVEATTGRDPHREPRRRSGLAAAGTSDPAGRFTLYVRGGSYRLTALSEGFRAASASHVEAGTEKLRLTLERARSISGVVVDSEGRPVASARVSLHEAAALDRIDESLRSEEPAGRRGVSGPHRWIAVARAIVETGEDGAFRFDDADVSDPVLFVESAGFVPTRQSAQLSTGSGLDPIKITLKSAAVTGGVVRDRDGNPVAGAFVAVSPASDEIGLSRSWEVTTQPLPSGSLLAGTTTDAQGAFLLDSLAPGEYAVSVETKAHPIHLLPSLSLRSGAKLEIELQEGFALRGRVLASRDGEPIAQANVRASIGRDSRTAKSDSEGSFEILGLSSDLVDEVRVAASGYGTAYFDDVILDDQRDFEVDPPARLAGRVLSRDGRPVSRAQVSLTPSGLVASTRADAIKVADDILRSSLRDRTRLAARAATDVHGSFELVDIEGGGTFTLTVDHPAYKQLEQDGIEIPRGESVDNVELVLESGASLEVFTVDQGGSPIAGANVRIELRPEVPAPTESEQAAGSPLPARRTRRSVNESAVRRTGPDGRAVFSSMQAGLYRIRAQAAGYQFSYAEARVRDGSPARVIVALDTEHTIAGIIVDPDDKAIEGARVTAVRETPDPLAETFDGPTDGRRRRYRGAERPTARTGADGTYLLGQLAPTKYSITFEARGFVSLTVDSVRVDQELNVTLDPLGSISGRVVDSDTGGPIRSFRVLVRDVRQLDSPRPSPIDDGARFSERRRSDLERWLAFNEGTFRVDGLEAGAYVIEATAEDYTGATSQVRLRVGEQLEGIVLELDEGVSLRGYVKEKNTSERLPGARLYLLPLADREDDRDNGGERRSRLRTREDRGDRVGRSSPEEDVAQALVFLDRARSSGRGERAEDDGSFKLGEVRDGEYMLVVEHRGYLPVSRKVNVQEGVRAEYAIIMDPGESLHGRVRSGRRSRRGITVIAESANGVRQSGTTDRQGRYKISGLLPGSYSVRIQRGPETLVESLPAEIKDGKRNELDYRHETR